MSELTVTVVRLGLLALLWIFVFSVVGVLRGDLFGTRVSTRRPPAPPRSAVAARPVAAPPVDAAPRPKGRAARKVPREMVVTEGPLRGTTITLGHQSILIGRNPESTLVLSDDYASGRHARIFPKDGDWYVEDLSSTNGTFVGQQRVTTEPVKLGVGSSMRIGTTVLELRR
ncbi:MAG TPA: FHA domain-containing protein [Actinomycetales bacterium]|nr:FHA domain-containing protein [Actinomycetales bacterium]